MSLRVRNASELEAMSSSARDQIGTVQPGRSRPRYLEEAEGRQIVQYVDWLRCDHETLGRIRVADYFVHVPNGGARNATEAAILQGQGARKAWPDYALYIPRGRFLGAVAELKQIDGDKPGSDQLEILLRLERMGYKAMVWFGADDARKQLIDYLSLGPFNPAGA